MASLTTLLQTKYDFAVGNETNLEQGRIYQYYVGSMLVVQPLDVHCLLAPSAGTATIEIWGAGGSGAEMCCCGFGLNGNPGAYSKKTLTMAQGCSHLWNSWYVHVVTQMTYVQRYLRANTNLLVCRWYRWMYVCPKVVRVVTLIVLTGNHTIVVL